MKRQSKMSVLLGEERVFKLIDLATKYASSQNLDAYQYVSGLLDPNRIGSSDAGQVVETLIKYHEEWVQKSNT